jgi:hypothetical protein
MPQESFHDAEFLNVPQNGALVTVTQVVHVRPGLSFAVYGAERQAEVVPAETFNVSNEQLVRMGCLAVRQLTGDSVPRLTPFMFADMLGVASCYRSPLMKLPASPGLRTVILER